MDNKWARGEQFIHCREVVHCPLSGVPLGSTDLVIGSTTMARGMEWFPVLTSSALSLVSRSITSIRAQNESVQ